MSSTTFEGFSLTHAAILDGTTGAEEAAGDIYGIRSGTIAVDTGNYDNTGDDAVLSSWFWFNYATVTVQSGYIPLDTLALLSGSTITTTGVAPADTFEMQLWEETSLNQPVRPMLVRVPSKDKDGLIRTLDFVLYKVQFGPFSFDGPSYKSGLLLNYTGRAVMSDKDETGTALTTRAIGRLISKPAV